MKAFVFFLSLAAIVWTVPAGALRYATDMDESQWITDASPYVCRLEHHIAGYGTGAFVHHAGEDRRLELDGQGISFGETEIKVLAEPPTWQPRKPPFSLAAVQIKHGELHLDEQLSSQVAAELLGGMMIAFRGKLKESEAQPLEVHLSTVGFRGAFDDFTVCEDQLLPANFAQLERSRIQYKTGQIEVDGVGRGLLRKIVRYLEVDSSVKQIFIDGHTDSVGMTRNNVKVSQQRAELVRDFLVSRGVDEQMLVVRYHAEKYPVASNDTPANRAKNRRTTVRLSRVFTPQVEPEIENTVESDSVTPEAESAPLPVTAEE
jgi:outer membrane protein OmpA-like peptidoglycan-associated protein